MVCVNYIMKHLFLLIAVTFFFGNINAQSKCAVTKAKAYFTIQQPGNIAVDENGRERKMAPAKERVIYIATSCSSKPVIASLKYGSAAVKATVENTKGNSILLAKNEEGEDIYFKAAKGNYIWKINVEQNDETIAEDGKPNIYLRVQINKRTQIIRMYSETLLPSPDRP